MASTSGATFSFDGGSNAGGTIDAPSAFGTDGGSPSEANQMTYPPSDPATNDRTQLISPFPKLEISQNPLLANLDLNWMKDVALNTVPTCYQEPKPSPTIEPLFVPPKADADIVDRHDVPTTPRKSALKTSSPRAAKRGGSRSPGPMTKARRISEDGWTRRLRFRKGQGS